MIVLQGCLLLLLQAGWNTLSNPQPTPHCRRPPGRARPPTLSQKGGRILSPHGRDINAFVSACETLLGINVTTADLTEQEGQLIQYYIAALAAKFPALVD